MTLAGGASVVESAAGPEIGVSDAITEDIPVGETPGAQANRARVQRRTGKRIFLISA
jgi:hypothetical protein